jgi:hypothetical protein
MVERILLSLPERFSGPKITEEKEVMEMKRFMVPRVAHCSEGC